MHIGIDIGYSSVKLAFGSEQHPVVQTLPVGAARRTQMLKSDDNTYQVGSGFLVMVNDEEWVAGVSPGDIPGFTRTMDKDYPKSPEYLALFRAALSRVGAPVVDQLVIGLPVFQFKDDSQRLDLQKRLEGRHYIRPDLVVDVRSVRVIAQPAGAIGHHMSVQPALPPEERIGPDDVVLIVDPGHFSIDWVVFRRGFDTNAAGSTSTAGESIVQAAAAALSQEYGVEVKVPRLERAILSGQSVVSASKVEIPFGKALEEQASQIVEANLKVIRGSVRRVSESEGVDVVLLTGGSAKLFAPALAAKFPESRVIVTPDNVMANARGFFRAAAVAARKARSTIEA